MPTGAAFFTGQSHQTAGDDGDPSQAVTERVKVEAGTDGAVFMPGSEAASAGAGVAGGGPRVARSAAESIAAAARARAGEGEEIIVAEIQEGDDGDDEKGRKKSVLDGPSRAGLPSLFDDEQNQDGDAGPSDRHGVADAFLYDSDSSAEERRARRRSDHGGTGERGFRMPPSQLPFPMAPHQPSMYDCQDVTEMKEEEEKKMAEPEGIAATALYSTLSDPPLKSPFLDLTAVSDEVKQQVENGNNSWFVMKFPTRLPHLDTSSSTGIVKNEVVTGEASAKKDEESSGAPDKAGSAVAPPSSDGGGVTLASVSGPALGYDDTLKDAASGRYGRIVVRKSGKTELVIGEGDNEVRLLVHEGLQCGFSQQAVCIDPDESSFVAMGGVGKSLIVTPDIERAFEFS